MGPPGSVPVTSDGGDKYLRKMLTNTLRTIINNLFKKIFYGKRKISN